MNFLELVQAAFSECDCAGTPPVSVVGNQREVNRLVGWVRDAYVELQNSRLNWEWLRSRFLVNTVPGTDTYAGSDCTDTRLSAPLTRHQDWWVRNQRNEPGITRYLASAGVANEVWLVPLDWATYRRIYKRGPQRLVRQQPVHVVVDPQNQLAVGPNPNDVYTIEGEYQMRAQVLTADADIPEMPVQYHRIIVYDAMLKYAFFESASEVKMRADSESRRIRSDLEENQLPELYLGLPLA